MCSMCLVYSVYLTVLGHFADDEWLDELFSPQYRCYLHLCIIFAVQYPVRYLAKGDGEVALARSLRSNQSSIEELHHCFCGFCWFRWHRFHFVGYVHSVRLILLCTPINGIVMEKVGKWIKRIISRLSTERATVTKWCIKIQICKFSLSNIYVP